MLNLKIALLVPSKHSSVDFALGVKITKQTKTGRRILKFLKICIMAIYIILIYILYKFSLNLAKFVEIMNKFTI
tara:strand:- start:824 stop:1045 length:222 start_codon:yes stop_codon:yes gene_type:complete